MALRRSRVRIPLGPQIEYRPQRFSKPVRSATKVLTGVVGHPVSEKGRQGGSPSIVSNGNTETELACRLARGTSLVNRVVSDG